MRAVALARWAKTAPGSPERTAATAAARQAALDAITEGAADPDAAVRAHYSKMRAQSLKSRRERAEQVKAELAAHRNVEVAQT